MPDDRLSIVRAEWLLRVLGVDVGQAATAEVPREAGTVQLQKSRLAWDGLRKTVQVELQSLERAIIAGVASHNDDPSSPDEFEAGDVAASTRRLYTVLDGLDAGLIDTLDDALNASGEDRLRHQAAARTLIGGYRRFVAGDPLVQAIDANGFIPTTLKASVERTLADLDAAL